PVADRLLTVGAAGRQRTAERDDHSVGGRRDKASIDGVGARNKGQRQLIELRRIEVGLLLGYGCVALHAVGAHAGAKEPAFHAGGHSQLLVWVQLSMSAQARARALGVACASSEETALLRRSQLARRRPVIGRGG